MQKLGRCLGTCCLLGIESCEAMQVLQKFSVLVVAFCFSLSLELLVEYCPVFASCLPLVSSLLFLVFLVSSCLSVLMAV